MALLDLLNRHQREIKSLTEVGDKRNGVKLAFDKCLEDCKQFATNLSGVKAIDLDSKMEQLKKIDENFIKHTQNIEQL